MKLQQFVSRYRGAVRVMTAVVVGFMTSSVLVADAGAVPASAPGPPPTPPLRVLTMRGLWYQDYAIERALARMGGAVIGESWHAPAPHLRPPTSLRLFPESLVELKQYHVLVICNTNGNAFPAPVKQVIVDYVNEGGAVLFLGGFFAFGSQYRNSEFADIAPVEFHAEPPRSISVPDGLVLEPGKAVIGKGFARLNWKDQPRVYWHHPVTPKPGSKVVLASNDTPLLILGEYGKGRVGVFAGSVLGVPGDGHLPFWQWDDWPEVLVDTFRWLTENQQNRRTPVDEAMRKQWAVKLTGPGLKKVAQQAPLLKQVARVCADAETAHLLLAGVACLDDEPPLELITLIDAAVHPYVGAESVELAKRLMFSGKPGIQSLGLRVLGRSKDPAARKMLEDALKDGRVESLVIDDFDADLHPSVSADPDANQYVIRLGALQGLGALGDSGSLPLINTYVTRYAAKRSDPSQFPTELTPDDELYQEAVLAAVRCGDSGLPDEAIDALMENRYVTIRMLGVITLPHYGIHEKETWDLISRLQARFPRQYARTGMLPYRLADLPPGVLPALAERIAREKDPRVIPYAYAAFGNQFQRTPRVLSDEVLTVLKGSTLKAVADLALQTAGGKP